VTLVNGGERAAEGDEESEKGRKVLPAKTAEGESANRRLP
jgi:hypothetical protein